MIERKKRRRSYYTWGFRISVRERERESQRNRNIEKEPERDTKRDRKRERENELLRVNWEMGKREREKQN